MNYNNVHNNINNNIINTPHNCPGVNSINAGKTSTCNGCPNQKVKKKKNLKKIIFYFSYVLLFQKDQIQVI